MAIMKIENHAKRGNVEAKWNALADYLAKQAALTKVMILSKHSRDKTLEELKEAIIKYQQLVPDSEKEEWEKSVCSLHSDNLVSPR